jgi:Tfp pilus assembly protein PilV
VLVATVIMGVAVAGLIGGLSQSVKNAARLKDYDRAAMLARTKMNDLCSMPICRSTERSKGSSIGSNPAVCRAAGARRCGRSTCRPTPGPERQFCSEWR